MIRPFGLRDIGLLYQLNDNCVPLNASLILTFPSPPLRGALLNFALSRNYPTYIWRSKDRRLQAFVQLRLSEDKTQAHVLWVGWQANGLVERVTQIWRGLFEELGIYLGKRGVQNFIVEAREDSEEARILHELGFANYTRQDIWRLDRPKSTPKTTIMRQRSTKDDWYIELLYAHIVPNMMRLIEPHPPMGEDSWVLFASDTELAAYAHIKEGSAANWLRLFVKMDDSADADKIVHDTVVFKPPSAEKPLYACVRQYQDWLQNALRRNNFSHFDSQVVMVRHTTQAIKKPISSLEQVLATNGAAAKTSPIIQKSEQTNLWLDAANSEQ